MCDSKSGSRCRYRNFLNTFLTLQGRGNSKNFAAKLPCRTFASTTSRITMKHFSITSVVLFTSVYSKYQNVASAVGSEMVLHAAAHIFSVLFAHF